MIRMVNLQKDMPGFYQNDSFFRADRLELICIDMERMIQLFFCLRFISKYFCIQLRKNALFCHCFQCRTMFSMTD